jgi:DNA integrity scanning protein DisA with diadenylate cyclase activity
MGFRKTLENTKGTNTTGQLATLGTRHRNSGNIGQKTQRQWQHWAQDTETVATLGTRHRDSGNIGHKTQRQHWAQDTETVATLGTRHMTKTKKNQNKDTTQKTNRNNTDLADKTEN